VGFVPTGFQFSERHHDPLGPGIVSFRDPDNFQWEFFEER
jgi:hypothetical protein